ncbi:hypothetical protein B0H66DRAFT_636439, partial [Apodospora peruviana]
MLPAYESARLQSSKEPDSAGGPDPDRAGDEDWPTLVVQAGYSESYNYLFRDMARWFVLSNHDVKIVLLVHWNRQTREITLERWEEEERSSPAREGVNVRILKCQQTIIITRHRCRGEPFGNMYMEAVAGGDIVLKFSSLFLREPRGRPESDIVVTEGD